MKKSIIFLALFSAAVFAQPKKQITNIRIDKDMVFVDNKEVVKTGSVAQQDSLLVEALVKELKDKRKGTAVQIYVEQNISYDVFFKVMVTAGFSGFTDISYTSKIDGKNYTGHVQLPGKNDTPTTNQSNCGFLSLLTNRATTTPSNDLCLIVAITEDYIEIWVRGGTLPKMLYKKNFVYDELKKTLNEIYNRFRDLPDGNSATFIADDDVAFWKILKAEYAARAAGFTGISMTKLMREIQKKEEEEETIDFGDYCNSFYCYYDETDATYRYNICSYYGFEGSFDIKTGKILNYRPDVGNIIYQNIEGACTIKPEWGKDYVDKECVEAHKKKIEPRIKKWYDKIIKTSVFRACYALPEGD
jgi:biopolymer transport protein ExbD